MNNLKTGYGVKTIACFIMKKILKFVFQMLDSYLRVMLNYMGTKIVFYENLIGV